LVFDPHILHWHEILSHQITNHTHLVWYLFIWLQHYFGYRDWKILIKNNFITCPDKILMHNSLSQVWLFPHLFKMSCFMTRQCFLVEPAPNNTSSSYFHHRCTLFPEILYFLDATQLLVSLINLLLASYTISENKWSAYWEVHMSLFGLLWLCHVP
jgi:hypothetical protein